MQKIYTVSVEQGDEYYIYSAYVAYAGDDKSRAMSVAMEECQKFGTINCCIETWEGGEVVHTDTVN
jgi:hypothetical protein